jgi:hypothetical protein
MANGHGGARPGAGRKKKPLAEKILEGDIKKHKAKVLNFGEIETPELEVPEYLGDYSKTLIHPNVIDFYKETATWLERTGCLHLVNPAFITEYAILKIRWLECERVAAVSVMVKDRNGEYTANPMSDLGIKYLKQADLCWSKIWSIVAQNSEVYFGNDPNDDIMEALLRGKQR